MYLLFAGASLKIAKHLIHVTGMRECWALIQDNHIASIPKPDLLREVLGLNAANLQQSLLEESVDREMDPDDLQDILEDYIVENLRQQDWVPLHDGAVRMEKCLEILTVTERLKPHFNRTRVAQGFPPRKEAVKDLLRKLGNESNRALQEGLLTFVEGQHDKFAAYFRDLLGPLSDGPTEVKGKSSPTLAEGPPAAPEKSALNFLEPPLAAASASGTVPKKEPSPVAPPDEANHLLEPKLGPALIPPPVTLSPQLAQEVERASAELKAPPEVKPPAHPPSVSSQKMEGEAGLPTEEGPVKPHLPLPDLARLDKLPQAALPSLEELRGIAPHAESADELQPEESEVSMPETSERPTEADPTVSDNNELLGQPQASPDQAPAPLPPASSEVESPLPALIGSSGKEGVPLPKGFARTVDPKKLAKVLEYLLSIEPSRVDLSRGGPASSSNFPEDRLGGPSSGGAPGGSGEPPFPPR